MRRLKRHRIRNILHSVVLIAGMVALLALLGYFIAGLDGLLWAAIAAVILMVLGQHFSSSLVLRMYGAVPLSSYQSPNLYRLVTALSQRANLEHVPRLYYIPSRMMNAFSVGSHDDAALGITDGMLRRLSLRELAGVLAHEMTHIQRNDMRVMAIADVISRVTTLFSLFGQFLLLINLPLLLVGKAFIAWPAIALLIVAPVISGLLQLALSRARESEADLGAAELTGDPAGLAMALEKMEYYDANWLKRILMPGHRVPDPSLFRSHPKTSTRVDQLMALARVEQPALLEREDGTWGVPEDLPQKTSDPHWHITGLWH
jgi:heat shock protein HtpX